MQNVPRFQHKFFENHNDNCFSVYIEFSGCTSNDATEKRPRIRKSNKYGEHLNFYYLNKDVAKFSLAITKASTKIHRKGRLHIYQIYSNI